MGSRRAILKGSLLEYPWTEAKTSRYRLLDYISDFGLIFLSETWQSKTETLNFDISGFCCELIPENKSRALQRRFSILL